MFAFSGISNAPKGAGGRSTFLLENRGVFDVELVGKVLQSLLKHSLNFV